MVIVKKAGEPNCFTNEGYHKQVVQTTLFFVYSSYQVVQKKSF